MLAPYSMFFLIYKKVISDERNKSMNKYSEILKEARENFCPLILDEGANFLFEFCKKEKPKNILEIGTSVGYSACLMLDANNESFVTTIEIDKEAYEKAFKNFKIFGYDKRVKQILGDAKEEVLKLKEKFDLIFLDGPKGQYYKLLPHLLTHLNQKGFLIADNIFFHGKVKQEGKIPHKHRTIVTQMRMFIEAISTNENLQTDLFELGDGISVTKQITNNKIQNTNNDK